MPSIKDVGMIASKWQNRTSSATSEYEQGVRSPRRSWAQSAKAAENNYKTGVAEAAAAGRYGRGVDAAGDSAWSEGALNLGAGRFAGGVQAAEAKYQARFAKFAQVISSTALPPRGAKGSPANLQRVAVMATALRTAKTGK